MSLITDYASLQANVATWLARTDLTADIPTFIQLAEAKIKRRLRRKTVVTTLAVAASPTALPATLAELRSLRFVTGSASLDRPLTNGTLEMVNETRARLGGIAGRPQRFAVQDGQLYLAPAPDQSYTAEISYYQALVALSGSNTTNVVLTEAPDIYLYGALCEAEPYLEHDERIPVWKTAFDSAIEELNDVREREETAASIRPVRLPRVF